MTTPLATADTRVWVDHHGFRIAEPDNYDALSDTRAFRVNGLVVPGSGVLWVHAGIALGYSRVTLAAFNEPAAPDAADWEDIVEVSLPLNGRVLTAVNQDDTHPRLVPVELPAHSGQVRIRAHARGRDLTWDGTAMDPVEDYLFQIWPAPEAPPVIHVRSNGRASRR